MLQKRKYLTFARIRENEAHKSNMDAVLSKMWLLLAQRNWRSAAEGLENKVRLASLCPLIHTSIPCYAKCQQEISPRVRDSWGPGPREKEHYSIFAQHGTWATPRSSLSELTLCRGKMIAWKTFLPKYAREQLQRRIYTHTPPPRKGEKTQISKCT